MDRNECWFEDCFVMWELFKKYGKWDKTFDVSKIRKPDGDALQDLSLDNYYVMRDHLLINFLLQKKLKQKFMKSP